MPEEDRKRPGPLPNLMRLEVVVQVVGMARANPWYGYKRIAVMCRRAGCDVTNREAYKVMKYYGLLQRRKARKALLYQAAKLWELLPNGPNDLWQMDVTYVHIPGYGWWYAVTVIDYYSRYLLAARLTSSYSAREVIEALKEARAEAERVGGPLKKNPFLVTDNGPSFVARRFGVYTRDLYAHVRIAYRTPQQLGLLERFHKTFKEEEVYWRMYNDPGHARECIEEFRERYNRKRPHWALIPSKGGDPVTPEDVYAKGVSIQIPRWQQWARAAKAKLDRMLAVEEARAAS
jgi:transposase InsO family protein